MADLNDLRGLCYDMAVLQADIEEREEATKLLKAQLDDLRLRRIPEMMEVLEVKTATFDGIGRVQLAGDLYCSTAKGRKDEAMQWLRDCGYEDMISESYNATSMKALIRRLLIDGMEVPEFMQVTPFTRASIVKA